LCKFVNAGNIYVLWLNCFNVLFGHKERLPHIHVRYGGKEAIYEIPDGNLLEGSLPVNKEKLLLAWIEIHKEDLMANRELTVSGNKVFTIEPLK